MYSASVVFMRGKRINIKIKLKIKINFELTKTIYRNQKHLKEVLKIKRSVKKIGNIVIDEKITTRQSKILCQTAVFTIEVSSVTV